MNFENRIYKALSTHNTALFDETFELIYHRYTNLSAYIISKYVHSKEDVEELVSDVFLNLYQAFFKTTIKNIIYYIATQSSNAAINYLKTKRLPVVYDDEIIMNQSIKYNTLYDEIIGEMSNCLSEMEINIIILHSVYDYSFKDLSIKYQKPISTISSIYYTGIKKFNKRRKAI